MASGQVRARVGVRVKVRVRVLTLTLTSGHALHAGMHPPCVHLARTRRARLPALTHPTARRTQAIARGVGVDPPDVRSQARLQQVLGPWLGVGVGVGVRVGLGLGLGLGVGVG